MDRAPERWPSERGVGSVGVYGLEVLGVVVGGEFNSYIGTLSAQLGKEPLGVIARTVFEVRKVQNARGAVVTAHEIGRPFSCTQYRGCRLSKTSTRSGKHEVASGAVKRRNSELFFESTQLHR